MENHTVYSHEKIDLLTLDVDKLKYLQNLKNYDTTEDFKSIKQKMIGVEEYLKGISEFPSYKIENHSNLPKTQLFIFKDKMMSKDHEISPPIPNQIKPYEKKVSLVQEKKENIFNVKEEQKLNKEKDGKLEEKKIELKPSFPSFNLSESILKEQPHVQPQIKEKETKNIFGIKSQTQAEKPEEDKIDIYKINDPKIKKNIFGSIPEKPTAIQPSQPVLPKQVEQADKKFPINQPIEQAKPHIKSPQESQTITQTHFPIKEKLIKSANNYWNLRDMLKKISQNPKNKKATDKILFEINTVIDQISQEEHLEERIKTVNTLLKEITNMNDKELYVYTLNYICQRIILKSDKYKKEHKKIFLTFAKFIYRISQEHKLLQDYFMMMIVYKCPYVIPITYNKKDFKDNYTYMKRLGYSTDKETMSDMINNMECYGYFYFAFLSCDNKFIPIIKEYMDILEMIVIDYPIATVFKTFLNTLGNYIKDKIPNSMDKLKKLTERLTKGLNDLKSISKSSLLKSIAGENLHFIKLYYKNISTGVKTDMYD